MWCRRASGLATALVLVLAPALATAQGLSRWFLAEGANNAVFTGEILIGNPGSDAVDVTVRLLPQADALKDPAKPWTQVFRLAPTSRKTVSLGVEFGLNGSVSAEVSAVKAGTATPADIVVERSMYFPDGTRAGGHNASGVTRTSETWILAEGATHAFDTFVLVANPNASATRVRATYLTATGASYVTEQLASPDSRITFWPAVEHAGLASAEFSTIVESLTPGNAVVAERAMYFNPAGSFMAAGHDALGVDVPSTTWYFAEGITGGNAAVVFETFLLLANQHDTDVNVTVTYQLDTGEALSRTYTVPARQRFTVWVDQEGRLFDSRLIGAAFGMSVQATLPIVAERAVYWGTPSAGDPLTPAMPWHDGHGTAGAPAAAARWAFADGAQDYVDASGQRYQTFLLLSNPNPTPIAVRATFVREDGSGVQFTRCVPGNGRADIWTATLTPLSNRRFAAFTETIATPGGEGSACPTATAGGEVYVAERAMYWGDGFTGGHANVGTPWTGSIAAPGAPVDTIAATVVGNQGVAGQPRVGRLSGNEWVLIDVPNAGADLQVAFDGRRSPAVQFLSPDRVRALTPRVGSVGTKTVTVTSRGQQNVVAANGFAFTFRVLAIGDSFTEGLIVERDFSVTPPKDASWGASPPYPQGLRAWLSGYAPLGGGVVVHNEGRAGECVSVRGCSSHSSSGASRIEGLVKATAYDVVVIMEGFNDFNDGANHGASLGSVIDALRFMGRTARASGSTVIMGILEPSMNSFGGHVAAMADQEGFHRHSFRGIELGNDDVHPTQRGYDEMARQMFDKIKAIFP